MSAEAREASRTMLLTALDPDPARFAQVLPRCAGAVDWDWLLDRAAAHKVTALLADRLGAAGAALPMPDSARRRLSEATARARDRNAKGLRDLELVDRCLRGAGISYLLVKGPVLTQQIYDDPAQRHYFDLDVVVRETDVDAAQAALGELGYRLWGGDRYLGFAPDGVDDLARATRAMRAGLKRFGFELALVTEAHALLPIDVHWHLLPPGRIRIPAARIWESTTSASIGGVDVRVLTPEATLLHLAMHAWSNRPWSFALLHLCDVAWALHRLPIDRRHLSALADAWGGRGDLDRAAYALERCLGIDVPTRLRMTTSPSARFRRLATAENLLERCTHPAPRRWTRMRQELEWGLAIGSLRSTAVLLLGKYTALLRYYADRG